MKLFVRIAKITALSLLLGLFISSPAVLQSASAAGPVTKTIVVRGSDGNLLAGAQVAVGYWDADSPNGWAFAPTATTDSNGQAVIPNLPQGDIDAELYVEPAEADLVNAIGFRASYDNNGISLNSSSTVEITLPAAAIRVNLKTSENVAAPVYTSVAFPNNSDFNSWTALNILREGPFNIGVDSSFTCSTNNGRFPLNFGYLTPTITDARTNYEVLISNCPTRTFSIQESIGGAVVSKVSGVYQLKSYKRSFKYSIVSPSDSSVVVDQSWLNVCIDNACYGGTGSMGGIGLPDGTYVLRTNAGSSGFASSEFTVTVTNGGTSSVIKVGNPATSTDVAQGAGGRFLLPLGVPNLSGSITKPNGETFTVANGQGFDLQLFKKNQNNGFDYVTSSWSQGLFAFNLTTTGEFKFRVNPIGITGYAATWSPIITVTNSSGIKLSWDSGTASASISHNISLPVPNVQLLVKNPLDNQPMSSGWVSVEKIIDQNGNRSWNGNFDLNPNSNGITGGLLEDGTYILTVNPPQGNQTIAGLASKQYTAVVSNSGSSVSMFIGNSDQGTSVTAVAGKFPVFVGSANVTGRLIDSTGSAVVSNNSSWVNVCLQRLRDDGINWDWLSCSQTSSTGTFSISVTDLGTYRINLEPQGRSDIATTTLSQFTINSGNVSSFTQAYGDVTAASPTLKLRVREVNSTVNVKFAGIEVRKNDQFVTWINTLQAGTVALNLSSAGSYQLIVNPTNLTPDSTRKIYNVTAVAGDGGAITATIEGVSPDANGISVLNLGAAQLQGQVLAPAGNTALRDSWVVAIDKNTNQEMWQFGANSSSSGSFAMSLPAGVYKIFARTPYGNSSYGNGDPLGDITVASDGTVTLSGDLASMTPTTLTLRLKAPYWSGKILQPAGNTGVANARVCLNVTINGVQNWNCAQTDNGGNWAMGQPAGFTDFGDNDQLQIAENQNPKFSMASFTGKTAIESSGFVHGGAGSIQLRLAAPNFTVRVVYGVDSTPANNLWVNVNAIAGSWLGGASTDANGYAKFSVSDLTKGVTVQVDTNNNAEVAAVAAPTNKRYEDSDMTSHVTNGAFIDTITLSPPNLRAIVIDPATNTRSANSWVELFDNSNSQWMGGSNTNSAGFFSMSLPPSKTYRLKVNPGWNGTTNSTSRSYLVTVGSDSTITSFVEQGNGPSASTITYGTGPAYSLTLGTPSVVGKVLSPTNAPVQNSWVTPTNSSNQELWQIGSNTKADGGFSMAVPDGDYTVQARAPWNSSSLSNSAPCAISITSGVITTSASGCITASHQLSLQLRLPNMVVRVLDADGNPLQNAHVGLGVGAWNVHAQTDSSGRASLLVDPAEVNSSNNGKLTGPQNITMWIDPPYGNTNSVRTQCYSGQVASPCANLAQVTPGAGAFTQDSITVTLPAPNTTVFVNLPNGTRAGANAWVSIIRIFKNDQGQETGRTWLAGGNTNNQGKATFNLIDTSVAFSVQVEGPWDQRSTYAGAVYESATGVLGLTWAAVNNQEFNLASPNLTLNARNLDNSGPVYSGWISVEKVNNSNNPIAWIAGYGLDQNGKVSMKLANSGRFRVRVNPGPGITGVATSCIVTTDVSGVVSIVAGECGTGTESGTVITLPLLGGNVTGTVSGPNGLKVSGAIVTASITGNPSDATTQVTSTNKDGVYNLKLDSSFHWDIKITPVNTPSDTVQLLGTTLTNRIVLDSQTTLDATLVAVAS